MHVFTSIKYFFWVIKESCFSVFWRISSPVTLAQHHCSPKYFFFVLTLQTMSLFDQIKKTTLRLMYENKKNSYNYEFMRFFLNILKQKLTVKSVHKDRARYSKWHIFMTEMVRSYFHYLLFGLISRSLCFSFGAQPFITRMLI